MKNHHHNHPIHPHPAAPLHEVIAALAYELWLQHGRPDNRDESIWLEAERQLVTERRSLALAAGS